MMVYAVYVFFMAAAGAAVLLLAGSDALINLSAASVVGSTPESVQSAKAVAIGVVLASVSLGAMSRLVKDLGAQIGIWTGVALVGVVSATFTIQGVSVDYAANDQSGVIQGARQDGNSRKIKAWEDEKSELEKSRSKREKSCSKHDRWYTCNKANDRIKELNGLIAGASDDIVESVKSEQVDISESVYEKTGIPGWLLERAVIYSRAIAIPLVIAMVTHIFFHLLTILFGDLVERKKVKKPDTAGRGIGAAVAGKLEGLLNGRAPSPTPKEQAPKPKQTVPQPDNVVNIKRPSTKAQTVPENANRTPSRTPANPRGSKAGSGTVASTVQLPKQLDKTVKDDEVRFKVVEYLIRRGAVKPSTRAIRSLGIGAKYVEHYIDRMAKSGVIRKGGPGKTNKLLDSMRIHEPVAKFEELIKAA